MNYAEEQLQNAIENENKKLKEENEKLVLENEKLYRHIQFRNKCFYELNDSYIELKKRV